MDTNRQKQNRDEDLSDRNQINESRSTIPRDLPESKRDEEELKAEESFMDLPEVKDIPGQEFIKVPSLGGLADTTLSSSDEEGDAVFGDGDEQN